MRLHAPNIAQTLLLLLTSWALGCSEDQGAELADADYAGADSKAPLPEFDGSRASGDASQACGEAGSFVPSAISGGTPYGNLNLEFERAGFANGCGAMRIFVSYLETIDSGYRVHFEFALPALQSIGQGAFSELGTYLVSVTTSACQLDGHNCDSHDTEGSVEIRGVQDAENLDPNTDLTLTLSDHAWDLPPLEVIGQSCAWTWNPC